LPLETDRYEFHKSHKSKVADSSFIYMLYEIQDVSLETISTYLEPEKPLEAKEATINRMIEDE